MIIWEGSGFLVGVITFACCLTTEFAVEAAFTDDQYYQEERWPVAAAFAVASILTAIVSRVTHRAPKRTLLDPQTGETVVLEQRDTFFFIPIRYWPPILLMAGIAFAISIRAN